MGVYIPNMEKPKKCVGCLIDERWCKLWKDFDSWDVETHPDCPLIELEEWNSYSSGKMYAPKGTFQKILDDERRADDPD